MLSKEKKEKENTAIKRTNKIKAVAKGLQGIKAISNTLGTSPTDTPEVNTKFERKYIIDRDGMGHLEGEKEDKKEKAY